MMQLMKKIVRRECIGVVGLPRIRKRLGICSIMIRRSNMEGDFRPLFSLVFQELFGELLLVALMHRPKICQFAVIQFHDFGQN